MDAKQLEECHFQTITSIATPAPQPPPFITPPHDDDLFDTDEEEEPLAKMAFSKTEKLAVQVGIRCFYSS